MDTNFPVIEGVTVLSQTANSEISDGRLCALILVSILVGLALAAFIYGMVEIEINFALTGIWTLVIGVIAILCIITFEPPIIYQVSLDSTIIDFYDFYTNYSEFYDIEIIDSTLYNLTSKN